MTILMIDVIMDMCERKNENAECGLLIVRPLAQEISTSAGKMIQQAGRAPK